MDFKTYQNEAVKTAIYAGEYKIIYPALSLANEAGEVLGKIKKILRDSGGDFNAENRAKVASEIGDTLWYLAALSRDLEISLDDTAYDNLQKLKDRQTRGVLGGSGDQR
jgi:NTP pyrophosphatase (non-canonical NTP hydrolase)